MKCLDLKKPQKSVLGTLALKDPELIKQLPRKKLEKIVISVDHVKNMVMVQGWKEPSGIKLAEAINLFLSMGINEYLVNKR